MTVKQRFPGGRRRGFAACVTIAAVMLWVVAASPPQLGAQRGGMFLGSPDDPAIAYATAPLSNVVDDLNRRLEAGSARLAFEGRAGYLASALEALALPTDSQLLLFSKASLQGRLIGPANPRALFFNDRVALGWVRDGDVLEVAAHDTRAGVVFYSLQQRATERPVFKREFRCLGCHLTGDTLGVPGLLMFSATPDGDDDRNVKNVMTPISALRLPSDSVAGSSPGTAARRRISAIEYRRSRAIRAETWPRSRDSSTTTGSARRRATSRRC